jgi:hypothetical protein
MVRLWIVRHSLAKKFKTANHRHQQIIEIVGNAAGQLASIF